MLTARLARTLLSALLLGPLAQLFTLALIQLNASPLPLCHPGSSSTQEFVDQVNGFTAASSNSPLSDTETETLISQAHQINRDFLQGQFNNESRVRKSLDLAANYQGHQAEALQIIERVYSVDSTAAVLPSLLSHLSGHPITDSESQLIQRLGVEAPQAYLMLASEKVRPYFDSLNQAGIKYTKDRQWDFSEADLSPERLQKDQGLQEAVSYFFSPKIVQELTKTDRRDSISLGGYIVLPPRRAHRNASLAAPVLSQAEYQERVEDELAKLSREIEEFKKVAKKVGSYSNLMRGRVIELFGGERGFNGKTAPEIELESLYSSINAISKRLKDSYGVPQELNSQLIEIKKQLNEYLSSQLDSGLQKLSAAKTAALSAPFIPLTLYLTPLAAGAIGVQGAGASAAAASIRTGQFVLKGKEVYGLAHATASTLAGIPLVFGGGLSTFNAAIDSAHGNGSFTENLQEEIATTGAASLSASAKLSALPLLTATGSLALGATLKGLSAGTAYSWGTTATGLGFMGWGAQQGVVGGIQCVREVQRVNQIAIEQGSEEAVRQASAEVWKNCIAAGFDMADALLAGGILSRAGVSSLRSFYGSGPSKLQVDSSGIQDRMQQSLEVLGDHDLPIDKVNDLLTAVERAHLYGLEQTRGLPESAFGPKGEYPKRVLVAERQILTDAGWTKEQANQILKRRIAGQTSTIVSNQKWQELQGEDLVSALTPEFLEKVDALRAHEILGVRSDADPLTVKSAYRQLMSRFHQDKYHMYDKEFLDRLGRLNAKINNAYAELSADPRPASSRRNTNTRANYNEDLATYTDYFESFNLEGLSLKEIKENLGGADGHRNPSAYREARANFIHSNLDNLLARSKDFKDSLRLYALMGNGNWSLPVPPKKFAKKLRSQVKTPANLHDLYVILADFQGNLLRKDIERLTQDISRLAQETQTSKTQVISKLLEISTLQAGELSMFTNAGRDFRTTLFAELAKYPSRESLDALLNMLTLTDLTVEGHPSWTGVEQVIRQDPSLVSYAINLFGRKNLERHLPRQLDGLRTPFRNPFAGRSQLDQHLASRQRISRAQDQLDEKYDKETVYRASQAVRAHLKNNGLHLRYFSNEFLGLTKRALQSYELLDAETLSRKSSHELQGMLQTVLDVHQYGVDQIRHLEANDFGPEGQYPKRLLVEMRKRLVAAGWTKEQATQILERRIAGVSSLPFDARGPPLQLEPSVTAHRPGSEGPSISLSDAQNQYQNWRSQRQKSHEGLAARISEKINELEPVEGIERAELQALADAFSRADDAEINSGNSRFFEDWPASIQKIPPQHRSNFLKSKLQEAEAAHWQPRMRIETSGLDPPSGNDIRFLTQLRPGMHMSQVQSRFDILTRKAQAPVQGLHEVDAAFVMDGIPSQAIQINSKRGELQFNRLAGQGGHDKVFAVDYRAALRFQGEHSNGPGQRMYALIYPDGFVEKFGADLRSSGSNGKAADNPSAQEFARTHAPQGRIFSIRSEPNTPEGQVHVPLPGADQIWDRVEINGKPTSVFDFINEQALGVIEYDAQGNILSVQFKDSVAGIAAAN